MKMRLAFSVSTTLKADIVLMDEWLSVGDTDFQEKATNRLDNYLADAGILMLASHSQDLIKKTCNKHIRLDKGKVVEYLS